ncbi:molybdate transporter subunit; periplasmic-binding component of ABC superfamily [uncultured delta proteobacterium]|uniref:Molybdate transporter subunit periplasmic-binding component of ABC superfamily n=1 Tax=uncultured delta proteobacterium TaxID=34034 RepID=A0A212JC36_9DELT|nr:molybdate transporter subunit; periplasmic-binding component of ABC superfamily [uncultured delta proteobacterium]
MRLSRAVACCAITLGLLGAGVLSFPVSARAAEPEIVVFAAASTTSAVTAIGDLYKAGGLGSIKTSFASSSTLAKQIEQGAPADVFLSADIEWMDYLDAKGLVAKNTRRDLLRNKIALIVPKTSTAGDFVISKDTNLLFLLGKNGRLAVGDPAHVPVGRYGKKALENLGLWDSLKDRIAPMKDVRAGLALVEQGEAPLGLVYASDVAASDKVRIIGSFPKGSHPDVICPAAAVAGNQVDAAGKFIAFLQTPEAKAIFKKYGFEGL